MCELLQVISCKGKGVYLEMVISFDWVQFLLPTMSLPLRNCYFQGPGTHSAAHISGCPCQSWESSQSWIQPTWLLQKQAQGTPVHGGTNDSYPDGVESRSRITGRQADRAYVARKAPCVDSGLDGFSAGAKGQVLVGSCVGGKLRCIAARNVHF